MTNKNEKQHNQPVKIVKRKEIYYATLIGSGSMQQGRRPVLVVQNDVANKFSPCVTILPLTSSLKKLNIPTHTVIHCDGLNAPSLVLTECITTIDKSMLADYVGTISTIDMFKIELTMLIHLGLNALTNAMKDIFAKEVS